MPFVIETISVGLSLRDTKRLIERANTTYSIQLENYPDLETTEMLVWGVGDSAVIAYSVDERTTDLDFVAVKDIPLEREPNLQLCLKQLRDAFEQSNKLLGDKLVANPQWDTSLFSSDHEWYLFDKSIPTKKEYKSKRRDFYSNNEVLARDFSETGLILNNWTLATHSQNTD